MTVLSYLALLIAVAAGGFSLGAWFTSGDDPTKQPSAEWDESMCARCPYNPHTMNEDF